MRRFWPLAAFCLLLTAAAAAAARPYTVDDLLHLQSLGPQLVDPTGRWLVLETRQPYDQAARFDYDGWHAYALGWPLVVDLAHPGPARPLLALQPGTGYQVGPFSPDGAHIVVSRHRDRLWETGIVTVATGAVRWLGMGAAEGGLGRAVQWRSSRQLVLNALPDGALPIEARLGRAQSDRLPSLWARTRDGQAPAYTVLGSGRYLADGPAPVTRRLLLIDIDSGALTPLAAGPWLDFELSADGRYAALLAAAEPVQPVVGRPVRMIDPDRRTALRLLDLETGQVRDPLPASDLLWSLLSWSPKSDSLLVYARPMNGDWPEGRLLRVTAQGVASPVGAGKLDPDIAWTPYLAAAQVSAGWLGDCPIVLARPAGGGGRADWYAAPQDGAVIPLTAGLPVAPDRTVAPVGQDLAVAAGPAVWGVGPTRVARRLAARGALRVSPDPGAGARGGLNPPSLTAAWVIAEASRGQRALDLFSGRWSRLAPAAAGDDPPLLLTRRGAVIGRRDPHGVLTVSLVTAPGRPIPLSVLNQPLERVDVAPPLALRHPGPGGATLTSWLYLPPTAGPGVRSPLIVTAYPGAVWTAPPYSGRPDILAFSESAQVLAGLGYAVLVPSLPRDPASRDPSQGFLDTELAAIDAAAATGRIDPERVALWGHSFGGYGALVAATRTRRFRAIIALNGVSDLTSLYGAFMPNDRVAPEDGRARGAMAGWSETGQGNMGAPPWAAPELYRRNSPLFAVDQIDTPLLLIGGDQDFLGLTQNEEMFTALWRLGKDAKLVTFWGEGHANESPGNVRATYALAAAFLAPLMTPATQP